MLSRPLPGENPRKPIEISPFCRKTPKIGLDHQHFEGVRVIEREIGCGPAGGGADMKSKKDSLLTSSIGPLWQVPIAKNQDWWCSPTWTTRGTPLVPSSAGPRGGVLEGRCWWGSCISSYLARTRRFLPKITPFRLVFPRFLSWFLGDSDQILEPESAGRGEK